MPAKFAATAGAPSLGDDGLLRPPAPRVRDTVLVVEDDPSLARLFSLFLQRCQLRSVQARDGAECLRLFAEHRERLVLVLMDCGLPDVDGGLLCHHLRGSAPGLAVLLTSGGRHEALCSLLSKEGPTGFLAKPFFPSDVMREVRALLPRETAV